jgi:hypothetical protein
MHDASSSIWSTHKSKFDTGTRKFYQKGPLTPLNCRKGSPLKRIDKKNHLQRGGTPASRHVARAATDGGGRRVPPEPQAAGCSRWRKRTERHMSPTDAPPRQRASTWCGGMAHHHAVSRAGLARCSATSACLHAVWRHGPPPRPPRQHASTRCGGMSHHRAVSCASQLTV